MRLWLALGRQPPSRPQTRDNPRREQGSHVSPWRRPPSTIANVLKGSQSVSLLLAERGGFEPPVDFKGLRRFSKPLLSTTQPPLRCDAPDLNALWSLSLYHPTHFRLAEGGPCLGVPR